MKGLKNLFNDFCESTTVHGLAYLTKNQHQSTKAIWFVIVLSAFTVAAMFVTQTIDGYYTKFTSTTIETKSIQNYAFPAVTFYPGDENLDKGFLRTFFNQIQLTRYNGEMKDDKEFMWLFDWLIKPMINELYNGIENHLLQEEDFIKKKGGIFRELYLCYSTILNLYQTHVCPNLGLITYTHILVHIRYIFCKNCHYSIQG